MSLFATELAGFAVVHVTKHTLDSVSEPCYTHVYPGGILKIVYDILVKLRAA